MLRARITEPRVHNSSLLIQLGVQPLLFKEFSPTLIHFMNPHDLDINHNLSFAVFIISNRLQNNDDTLLGFQFKKLYKDYGWREYNNQTLLPTGWYRVLHVHLVTIPQTIAAAKYFQRWWKIRLRMYELRYILNPKLGLEIAYLYKFPSSFQGNTKGCSRFDDFHISLVINNDNRNSSYRIKTYVTKNLVRYIDGAALLQHFFNKLLVVVDSKIEPQIF